MTASDQAEDRPRYDWEPPPEYVGTHRNAGEQLFVQRIEEGEFGVERDGTVWRLIRQGKPLAEPYKIGWVGKQGYRRISFGPRSNSHKVSVHRIIWVFFNGDIPEHMEVNHTNGDKLDCRLENLELTTPSGNKKHAYFLGLANRKGEAHNNARLTVENVLSIRRLMAVGVRASQIAYAFDISARYARKIRDGKAWPHLAAEEPAVE